MKKFFIKLSISFFVFSLTIQTPLIAIPWKTKIAQAEEAAVEFEDQGGGETADYEENGSVTGEPEPVVLPFDVKQKFYKAAEKEGIIPKGVSNLFHYQSVLEDRYLGGNLDKIYFENPVDEYAIFGESCIPPTMDRWLCTVAEGDDWIKAHPEDDIFANGVWDGPIRSNPNDPTSPIAKSIVDARIITMLKYLVTPTEDGGAGRERIGVQKIVQFSQNDREQKKTKDGGEEPVAQKTSHYIGKISEGKRVNATIQAIDISQIDQIRTTTKITKKRYIGGSKSSTKFQQPFPIKVAWQDDYGLKRAGVPPVDIYTGAEDFFKSGILSLLSDFEITDVFNPDDLSGANLKDIAGFVGSQLLAQILQSPNNSLDGFDFGDTMENFGRSVLADELKLPRASFKSGNSIADVERNIGQAILEQKFGFPEGALDGKTSPQIIDNIGRRFLEEEIFQVRLGTLDYSVPNNKAERSAKFFERLGAGRLEYQYNFKPGTFDTNSYDEVKNNGGLRFDLIFADSGRNDAYVDEDLGITVLPATSQLSDATKKFRESKNLQEYKSLIGHRVFEQTLGTLNQNLGNDGQIDQMVRGSGSTVDWLQNPGAVGVLNMTNTDNALPAKYIKALDDLEKTNPDPNIIDQDTLNDLKFTDAARYRGANLTDTPLEKISAGSPNSRQINKALDDIVTALKEDYITIYHAASRAHKAIDVTANNLTADQTATITAIDNLKNSAFEYLEAAGNIQQMAKQTPADQALDLALSSSLETISDQTINEDTTTLANSVRQLVRAGNSGGSQIKSSIVLRLQEGDIKSIMPLVGMLKLAQKTTDSPEERAAIEVNLFESSQSFFDSLSQANNLFGLGLSEVQVRGKFGLYDGDYDRIFLNNLGEDVFRRIGQAELLAAVWQRPEFQNLSDSIRRSDSYQDIEEAAARAEKNLNFYTSRLSKIKELANSNLAKIKQLDDTTEKALNAKILELYKGTASADSLTIDMIYDSLKSQYSVTNLLTVGNAMAVIGDSQRNVGILATAADWLVQQKVTDANNIYQSMGQIRHNIREIVAGKPLQYNRPDNIEVDSLNVNYSESGGILNKTPRTSCWTSGQLINTLLPSNRGNIKSNLTEGLQLVGACELEKKLDLPIGALYNFYKSDSRDIDSFYLSVGRAAFVEQNKSLPSSDDLVKKAGQEVVTKRIVQKLVSESGIFQNLTQKYPITGDVIFMLLSGRPEEAGIKMGGSLIDQRLHLTPGTTAELVDPCYATDILDYSAQISKDSNGAIPQRKCSNSGDRQEIRNQVMVREGMRQLGLDFDLPLGVDVTHGNFRDNLGRSNFETTLGISFRGNSLQAVIDANGVDKFLSAIGAPPTPFMIVLSEIKAKIAAADYAVAAAVNSKTTSRPVTTVGGQNSELFQALVDLNKIYDSEAKNGLLQLLRNPASDKQHYFWWISGDLTIEKLKLSNYLLDEQLKLTDKINGIKDSTYNLLPASAKKILDDARKQSENDVADQMLANARRFSSYISYLDAKLFKLDKDDNFNKNITVEEAKRKGELPPEPSMQSIIQETAGKSPDDLVKDFGNYALWSVGLDLINEKFSGTFVAEIIQEFRNFQTNVGGPTLEEILSGTGSARPFWSYQNIFTNEGQNAFRYFLDKFVGKGFSTKLDLKMGFEPGTLQTIIAQPNYAREIMIDQGMGKISSELFKIGSDDSSDTREAKRAFNEIFNAGFIVNCSDGELPPAEQGVCQANGYKNFYSLNFSQDRSIAKFRSLVDERLQDVVDDKAQEELGTTIPLSDINAIIHGDVRTIGYIAAAYSVNQINQKSEDELVQRDRMVSYATARLATIGDPNGPAVLAAGQNAEAFYYANTVDLYCSDSEGCMAGIITDSPTALYQAISAKENVSLEEAEAIYEEGRVANIQSAEESANRQIRNQATKTLQYQMMDTALFKLDGNFPLGFAESFFSSTATEETRNDAALLFAINKLSSDSSNWNDFFNIFSSSQIENGRFDIASVKSFRSLLSGLSCGELAEGESCQSKFFSTILTANGGAFTNYAYGQIDSWFAQAFGTDLDQKIFKGLLAWGATGELDGSYSYPGADGKPITVASLQDSVEGWASEKIFSWADDSLGFGGGVTKAIYQNGKQLYDAYKNFSFIQNNSDFAVGFKFAKADTPIDQLEKIGSDKRSAAKTEFKQAEMAFVTFAVTTIFKSQIGRMEQKLGLVPGTGTMAVGMLVNLAFGVPVDPITLAVFIGMNLFGYYKTVVKIRATADGYYPYFGQYGDYTFGGYKFEDYKVEYTDDQTGQTETKEITKIKKVAFQYPSPDPPIGEFYADAKHGAEYRNGLKTAAKAKIAGLLLDLATAPERWTASPLNIKQENFYYLMPSQVFTKLPEHIDGVSAFISRPPCGSAANLKNNGGCGYGPVDKRKYSGFWSNSPTSTTVDQTSFWDHIHIAY